MLLPLILSFAAWADQGTRLAQARDVLLDRSIENLKEYCRGTTLARHKHYVYLCHLQAKADCERKVKKACEVLKTNEEIERQALVMEKSVAQTAPQSVFSTRTAPEEQTLTYQVVYGAQSFAMSPQAPPPELRQRLDELEGLKQKINPLIANLSCDADDQCRLQHYGVKGCGGPMGTIVYSTKATDLNKILLVQQLTKLDGEVQDYLSRKLNVGDTCEVFGLYGTPKCVNSVCELR